MLMCKTSFFWTTPFCFLSQKGEVPCFDRFLQLQESKLPSCCDAMVGQFPSLWPKNRLSEKDRWWMNRIEPNESFSISQVIGSLWHKVDTLIAPRTPLLCEIFWGAKKFMARWSPITNSPVSKLPVTHVSQWNVVLLWTTRHHSWQEVLSNFPWCWDCIQQDQYPVLFAHASHLIHKTSEKDAVLLIHLQYSTISFAFFFLTSLFHTGWPNTSDQSDSGFLRIYNLRNPPGKVTVTAARRWLGEPRSQGIFFYSPSKGVFRCKSSFWTKILIPFHWLAKRDSHTGIQSGEPTSLWPKQPPFVLVLLRCLANGL